MGNDATTVPALGQELLWHRSNHGSATRSPTDTGKVPASNRSRGRYWKGNALGRMSVECRNWPEKDPQS